MDTIRQVQALDPDALAPIVRRALGNEDVVVTGWEMQPLTHFAVNEATGGLFRVAGIGQDHDQPVPWSVVLKVARLAEEDEQPSFWNYGKREFYAYQSGLLDDIQGGLVAPRCFGVDERSPAEAWIWLEHIIESGDARWPLERYGLAARHLGRFNGAYLTGRPLPRYGWLSAGLRSIVEPGGWWAVYMDPRRPGGAWEQPVASRVFPRHVLDEVLRIWRERAAFLDALERLPQVLCHGDAHRRNLLARRTPDGQEQTVGLDWAFLGRAAVGVELQALVGTTLFYCDVEPPEAQQLEEVAFAGYLAGLRDAGWNGDERQARLGYTAAITLSCGAMTLGWLTYLLDESNLQQSVKQYGRSADDIGAAFVSLAEFAQSRTAEARRLMETL